MKAVQRPVGGFAVLLFCTVALASRAESTVDPETGLIMDEHWELVRANCTACHSAKLVVQTRGERGDWLEMIRWMQKTQNLGRFAGPTEAAILDYLATHYAPEPPRFRRAPLDPSLLPPTSSSHEERARREVHE
jgi:hypothetical protein